MPVIVTKPFRLPAAFNDLTTREVLVGIPAGSARQPEPGEAGPIDNAVLGYLMESGMPERNIPARPFLVPGVESAREAIAARLKKAVVPAIQGDRGAVDQALNAVGLIAQAAVQSRITDGPFEPLAERTLKQRRARGRTGTKPLIDTGALRQAITYVIRGKGPNR